MRRAQNILEYVIVLTAIIVAIIAGAVWFAGPAQQNLMGSSAQNVQSAVQRSASSFKGL